MAGSGRYSSFLFTSLCRKTLHRLSNNTEYLAQSRRTCTKPEVGERTSGREKLLCKGHNHSFVPPAPLHTGKALRIKIEPRKWATKGVLMLPSNVVDASSMNTRKTRMDKILGNLI